MISSNNTIVVACAAASWLVGYFASPSAMVCAKDEPTIKVEVLVDSLFIREYDPVLVKVVIENLSGQKQQIVSPGWEFQTLFLEVTRLDKDEFEELLDADGFRAMVAEKFPIITIEPRGQYAVYKRFQDFVFPHATGRRQKNPSVLRIREPSTTFT